MHAHRLRFFFKTEQYLPVMFPAIAMSIPTTDPPPRAHPMTDLIGDAFELHEIAVNKSLLH